MKNYGTICGSIEPPAIEVTSTSVFVATNIEPYVLDSDDHIINGYKYNYVEYTKDEYLLQQTNSITALQEELTAAKILLGVE